MLSTVGLLTALVASAAPVELAAQRTVRADPNAPRMMVGTLRGNERGLGVQAADAIRSRLSQDFPYKDLWVISKSDIHGTLEASGYRPDSALNPTDAKTLAQLLRADEYLAGTVTKNGKNYTVDARLVLARDNALVQPLPTVEAGRLDQVAMLLSKELQAARKQLASEKKCVQNIREQKFPDAAAAARQGIAAYEKSTLARLCLATAYAQMKQPPDSVLAITDQVLAIDPRSRYALELAAEAYDAKGDQDKSIDTWVTLLTTDPGNPRLAERVVNVIAASGHPERAKPIIDKSVQENPGDMSLVRLQWLIYLAMKDWKGAVAIGEEMVQTDTASADTNFFTRLSAAYANDSQPQKAAEAAARGIAKFPSNASLHLLYAQLLRTAGQLPQSLQALERARQLNPQADRLYLQLASTYVDLERHDSALVALQTGLQNGEDSTLTAQYALSIGNTLYRKANTSKTREDIGAAIRWLKFSDNTVKTPQAALLIGITSFNLGQSAGSDAPKSKSCELAQMADAAFNDAQIYLPRGAELSSQAVTQYMQYITQFQPVVANQIKQYCR
jgi:predicted Zn-dependent protease